MRIAFKMWQASDRFTAEFTVIWNGILISNSKLGIITGPQLRWNNTILLREMKVVHHGNVPIIFKMISYLMDDQPSQ